MDQDLLANMASVEEQLMDVDIDDEHVDTLGDLKGSEKLWEEIRDNKKLEPNMFVSGWENDEDGVDSKNLEDPKEQFLTAAEEGNLAQIQEMISRYPHFLTVRDRDNYTPLHRAAYSNHVDVCKYLLSVGADPEARTEDGWTVLHCAACWGNYEIVGILLTYGVDVNARSNGHLTPLHLAINSNTTAAQQRLTVQYLLEAPGIDMGAETNGGDTPLSLARRQTAEIFDLVRFHIERP